MSNGHVSLKAHCNRIHARRAAQNRFGVTLAPLDLRVIESMIVHGHGDAICLAPDYNGLGRPLYAVRWDGHWLPLCFDPLTRSVVTVLPDRVLDPYLSTLDPVSTRFSNPESGFTKHTGVGTALAGLPEVPALSLEPEITECDAALAALTARRCEVINRVEQDKSKPVRAALAAEISRLGQLRRAIMREKHVAYTRDSMRSLADRSDVDPDDPVTLIRAMYRALGDIGIRHGWDVLDETGQEVRTLARNYLELHQLTRL